MASCAKSLLPGWLSAFIAQHFIGCWGVRILKQLFKIDSINISIFQWKKSRPRKSKGFSQCLTASTKVVIRSSDLQTFLSQSLIGKMNSEQIPQMYMHNLFIKYSHDCCIDILSIL